MNEHPLLVPWALPPPPVAPTRPELPAEEEGWRVLLASALAHRLEVIFLHNLRAADGLGQAPDSVREVLESRANGLRMQNLHLAGAARALSAGLEQHGVEHLFLKGIALRSSAYAEIGGRPMGDIDVLVRETDRPRAEAALVSLGFAPDADGHATLWHARAASHSLHELTYSKDTPAQSIKVDLHWALTRGARCEPFDETEVWRETDSFDLVGRRADTLSRPWFLLHLALHLVKDLVVARPALLGYADLMLCARADDWQAVAELARRHGVGDEVEFVGRRLAVLAPWLVGDRGDERASASDVDALELLSVRDDDRIDADGLRSAYYRDLILEIPTWRSRLRYGAGLLLPPPRQLARMHRASTEIGSSAGYVQHLRQTAAAVRSWRPRARRPKGSSIPSDDELPLVRAALLPEQEALSIWTSWARDHDVAALPDHQYPILPLIYRRLRAHLDHDDVGTLLKGQYRHTWARQQLLRRELELVLQGLSDRGVAVRRYGWSALRSGAEISCLGEEALAVSRDALRRVSPVAQGLGWAHAPRHRVPPPLLPLAQRFDRRRTMRFAKAPALRLRVVGAEPSAEEDWAQRLVETVAAAVERPRASTLAWVVEIGRQLADAPPGQDFVDVARRLHRTTDPSASGRILERLAEAVGLDWPGVRTILSKTEPSGA